MFKLKFAKMYNNSIFEKYHEKAVAEDYFTVDKNIFCIADGVTRDSKYGGAIPYPKNKEEVEEWIKDYPNPSGAYQAAKICAEEFVKNLKENKDKIDEKLILETVKNVNLKIADINKNRDIDYLINDYFCCVAVGGCIVENTLYCFSIGDCHITTFDEEYNEQFTTINNHKNFESYLEIYTKEHGFDWNKDECRVMVRKEFRNKPNQKYKGKEISFGVLSGEKTAEHYIDVYKVDLSKTKYICAYSDGCEPIFERKEEIEKILQNPEELKKKGRERTLVIYEK